MRAASRASVVALGFALVSIAACGGDDDTAPAEDAASTTDEATTGASSENPPDENLPDVESSDGDSADDDSADVDTGGDSGGDLACDDIFDRAEIEEWFGEPTELEEEPTPSIGQIACTWTTVEDPNDLDDLAVSIITAQFFSGDPVPGASFIDPDIFDEVTMLDGYGDVAFTTDDGYYFYDDPVAGTLHFTDVDMGDVDAPPAHTAEEQEAMFRTFHDRVTG